MKRAEHLISQGSGEYPLSFLFKYNQTLLAMLPKGYQQLELAFKRDDSPDQCLIGIRQYMEDLYDLGMYKGA